MVALEVPRVPRADIHPLEVPNEYPLEVRPVTDVVVREEFKPGLNMFPHADGEILNDEIVIIHPSDSVGEPKIFEPNIGVCLPDVLGDVGGQSKALWEQRSLKMLVKGPWSWALRAGSLDVWPTAMPRARFTAPLDGSAKTCVAYPH